MQHFAMPAGLQKIADKRATVACKAETKGKKIRWPASRKYVKNCITTALKEHPTMDLSELHRGASKPSKIFLLASMSDPLLGLRPPIERIL